MARLPRNINIGPMKMQVVVDRKRAKEKNLWGWFEPDEHKIVVCNDGPHDLRSETLFHELIHACLHVSGVDLGSKEEKVVSALSPFLFDALINNPTLFAYLFQE